MIVREAFEEIATQSKAHPEIAQALMKARAMSQLQKAAARAAVRNGGAASYSPENPFAKQP